MRSRLVKKLPRISDAEWQVMRVVWERGRATTNVVVEALAPHSNWKPKTIMTLLKRLTDKGALDYEKKGRAHEFFPLVREADCVRAESRSFLKRVYGGALTPMLVHFLEESPLRAEDIRALRRILDERGKS
jgi:BlaI family penicillinase repressor